MKILCFIIRKYYSKGLKNIIKSDNKINNTSSRSHVLFIFNLESVNEYDEVIFNSKFTIVDLAGSEKSNIIFNSKNKKLEKESIYINTNLLILKKVILALSENHSLVPYRESKLTCILKNSLGGKGNCIMIGCLSDNEFFIDENINTLKYAYKTNQINNKMEINFTKAYLYNQNLKNQINIYKIELKESQNQIIKLNNYIKNFKNNEDNNIVNQITNNNNDWTKKLKNSGNDLNSLLDIINDLLNTNQNLREKVDEKDDIIKLKNKKITELLNDNTKQDINLVYKPNNSKTLISNEISTNVKSNFKKELPKISNSKTQSKIYEKNNLIMDHKKLPKFLLNKNFKDKKKIIIKNKVKNKKVKDSSLMYVDIHFDDYDIL